MHEQQRRRAAQLLDEQGIERALLSDIESVRWLTGLNTPAPALVWFDRGRFTLLADEGFAAAATFADNPDCAHASYVNYTIQQPIDAPGLLSDILGDTVAAGGSPAGRVGIEEKSLVLSLWQTLQDTLPGCEPTSLEGKLLPLRAVKTEEELARIREGFRLVTIGHDAGRKAVRRGSARSTSGPKCRPRSSGRRECGCRWATTVLSATGQPIWGPRPWTTKSTPTIP